MNAKLLTSENKRKRKTVRADIVSADCCPCTLSLFAMWCKCAESAYKPANQLSVLPTGVGNQTNTPDRSEQTFRKCEMLS
jgi:hypothetical protein